MEHRNPGRTGTHVGLLGFGGVDIGCGYATQSAVTQLLGEAWDAGLLCIDTADCDRTSKPLSGWAAAQCRMVSIVRGR